MCDAFIKEAYDAYRDMRVLVTDLQVRLEAALLRVEEALARPQMTEEQIVGVVDGRFDLLAERLKPASPPPPPPPPSPPEEEKKEEPKGTVPPPRPPKSEKTSGEKRPERRHLLHTVIDLPGGGRKMG